MRISLCMIVKDEIDNIEKCLEYAFPLVDETFIVDTGSTDGTREKLDALAKQENIHVIDAEWDNNFSKARNRSIKNANGDYILILDADERVFAKRAQVESILMQSSVDAYNIPIYNIHEDKEMTVSASMIRLYKNNKPEYKGEIHEQLYIDGSPAKAENIDADIIKIYHYGYSQVVFEAKDKQKRNMEIIKKQIQNEPYEPFHRYNKGVMEMLSQNYKSAMKDFLKAHELSFGERTGFHNSMIVNMIRCLFYQKKYLKMIEFINPLLQDDFFKNIPDIYYFMGIAFHKTKKLDKAIRFFNQAINIGDTKQDLSMSGSGSYLPMLEIARILSEQGKINDSIQKYKDAIKHPNNYNKNGLDEMEKIVQENGRTQEYILFIEELEEQEKQKTVIDTKFQKEIKEKIKSLVNANALSDANLLIDEYIKLNPKDADIYSLKGVSCILEKKYSEAIMALEIGFGLDHTNDDLVYNLAYAYEITGNKEKALSYYKILLELPGQSQDIEILKKVEELSKKKD